MGPARSRVCVRRHLTAPRGVHSPARCALACCRVLGDGLCAKVQLQRATLMVQLQCCMLSASRRPRCCQLLVATALARAALANAALTCTALTTP
eukprot:5308442-Prymnesium_polylepis.2